MTPFSQHLPARRKLAKNKLTSKLAERWAMAATITTDTRAAGRFAGFLRLYGVLTLVIFGSLSVGFAVHARILAKGGALNWSIWDDSVPGHVAPMLFAVYLV